MSGRDGYDGVRQGNGALLLPLAAIFVAVLAGSITALAGSMAGNRAVYLVAIPGALALAAGFALTRPQPLRFAFLSLVALLPFVNFIAPPGRLGLTVFDVATALLACGLLLHMAFARQGTMAPLFPSPSLRLMWVLLIPCALFAQHPLDATKSLLLIFAAYIFFWLTLQEIRRPFGFERLVSLLAVGALIISAGLFIDHLLHINLSLRGTSLNQLTLSGGQYVWRAGGFFHDGQKAGAFLATLLTFLLVLAVRGRFRETWLKLLVWSTIIAGVPALFVTVSRAAILTFLAVSVLALVATNRWPLALKLGGFFALLLLTASVAVAPDFWMALLPGTLAARVEGLNEDWLYRIEIWFDTWEMFANHPLTGIGPGGFQQYLLDTRPGVFDFYGAGEAAGVSYVPDQPESGYLKILYEGGILGTLATLLIIGASLRRAVAALASSSTGLDQRSEVIAALAGLAAFASTFTTLFTATDPRLLALLAILLAVVWRSSLPPAPVPK
jgi:O-antigen ligase